MHVTDIAHSCTLSMNHKIGDTADAMYHATVSYSCSKLNLVLSRLGGQGGLIQVVEVGVVHGSLGRDSLGWVIHLERRNVPDTILRDL